MVIDFAATWCGPCKFMEPAVKSMASKYTDVDFVKIDVDELPVCLSKLHISICVFLDDDDDDDDYDDVFGFWILIHFFAIIGCGAGVYCAGHADVCVVEKREGIWKGDRGQEGWAGEEDSETQGSFQSLNFFFIWNKLWIMSPKALRSSPVFIPPELA